MIFGLILEFYSTNLIQLIPDIKIPDIIPNVFLKTVESPYLLSI